MSKRIDSGSGGKSVFIFLLSELEALDQFSNLSASLEISAKSRLRIYQTFNISIFLK